jgi:hypothetical protein
MTLDNATRTAVFWVLSAAFFVSNFATAALSTHLIPYLVGRGYSATIAATVIGWMGAMQLPDACCSCRSRRGSARVSW